MVSTSDFNWTLPHGRMQFCHMVTYDPVLSYHVMMRTIFPTIQVFVRSFEIRNPTCTICCCRHDDLQFLESTKSVATAYCIIQPSAAAQRYAGSTHTVSGNCWHACRYAGNRTHAAVYPPVGNFWCATIHCSSEPRSCRSGTVRSSAGH